MNTPIHEDHYPLTHPLHAAGFSLSWPHAGATTDDTATAATPSVVGERWERQR